MAKSLRWKASKVLKKSLRWAKSIRSLTALARWYPFIIIVWAGLVYGGGLGNYFVAEDYDLILVSSLDASKFFRFITLFSRVKPLPLLISWLGYQFWGTSPLGHHALSLAVHLLCSVGVFYLATLFTRRSEVSLVAALVFSVYPRHHETVLWPAANQFAFGTAFLLLALLSFFTYLRVQQLRYYLTAFIFALGALASHEVNVMVLPLMFLGELVLGESPGRPAVHTLCRPRTYVKYIPFLLLLVLLLSLSFGGQRAFKLQLEEMDPRAEHETYHFMGISLNEIKNFVSYLVYLVLPQIPLRSLDVGVSSIILSLVIVGCLLSLFVFGTAVERFCLLWMGGALSSFVLFVPFGNADRYFYLPAVGFSLLVGGLSVRLYRWLRRRWTIPGRAVGILLLIIYLTSSAVLAQARIGEWRQAGQTAQDIIEQVEGIHPKVPSRSRMFFVGLPGRYGQAYVFLGGGIGGAMCAMYHDLRLKVYRSVDPELRAWLASREEGDSTQGEYLFLYHEGTIHDKSSSIDDFEQLYESWWWYQ